MDALASIGIIGPGRVGTAMGRLCVRAGYSVTAVAGRDPARARRAATVITSPDAACTPDHAARTSALLFLTVPDSAIADVCRQLADANAFRPGTIVAHCSGVLDSDVLTPARDAGAAVASLHPLQTFPSAGAAVDQFPGTYCFLEGDEAAMAPLETLATAIGGRPVRIAKPAKPLYHAAAVMACNYFTALIDAATALAAAAGIDPETYLAAVRPLVRATKENIFTLGPPDALTGPIVRGDASTVARHVQRIRESDLDPRLLALYQSAGEWTLALAQRRGAIDEPTAQELRDALHADPARDDP